MGRVIDIAWAPLPAPVGGGAVLLAATDDGGVAVLDACQASDAAPRRLRCIFVFHLASLLSSLHLLYALAAGQCTVPRLTICLMLSMVWVLASRLLRLRAGALG